MMNKEQREGFLLSATSKASSSKRSNRLNPMGKDSTTSSSIMSKNGQKTPPQYFRASTGSCHYFCKYGTKHTFESRKKHPNAKRLSVNSENQIKEQHRVKVLSLSDRQRRSFKQKASSLERAETYNKPTMHEEKAFIPAKLDHSEIQIINQSDIFLEKTSLEVIKSNFVPPNRIVSLEAYGAITKDTPEMIDLKNGPEVVSITQSESALFPQEELHNHEIQTIDQNSIFALKTSLSESPEMNESNCVSPAEKIVSLEGTEMITEVISPEKIRLSGDHGVSIARTKSTREEKNTTGKHTKTAKSSAKKFSSSFAPASVEQRTHFTKGAVTSIKLEVKKEDTLVPYKTNISSVGPRVRKKDISFTEKPNYTVAGLFTKSTTTALKSESMRIAGRKNDNKESNNSEKKNHTSKKSTKPQATPLSHKPQPPSKQISNLTKSTTKVKGPRKVGKSPPDVDKIREKTLYVIEPARQGRHLESSVLKAYTSEQSFSSSSILSYPPSVSDFRRAESQDVKSVIFKPCPISLCGRTTAENAGEKTQISVIPHPEKDSTPYNLQFRKGKMITPHSDNSSAMQLRFRQEKMLDNDQSVKRILERRTFRRRQPTGGDMRYPVTEAQAIVLRHQDGQDKKDAPDLFNQIIKETAKNLVKAKKSKVKALVGAFETVISLQEIKPI